jgi:hypothetical protein
MNLDFLVHVPDKRGNRTKRNRPKTTFPIVRLTREFTVVYRRIEGGDSTTKSWATTCDFASWMTEMVQGN